MGWPGFRGGAAVGSRPVKRPAVLLLAALAAGAAGAAGAACARRSTVAPTRLSPPPRPEASARFHAGFGIANITPDIHARPIGLGGYGPDGREARGVRDSLYARAVVLVDARGERVALVTVDLPTMAIRLHRLVAEAVAGETGIGADRLIISATHTHAGPGGIADAAYYNEFGSAVRGYDTLLLEFLVARVVDAVRAAHADLAPARAAWGVVPLWGVTRNRSLPAYRRNQRRDLAGVTIPGGLAPEDSAVDPRWLLLRVERWHATARCYTRGAFSVFAMHGTFIPNVNDQIDPDIFGTITAAMELRLAGLDSTCADRRPVAALANGTEGDVTAAWPEDSRCPTPRFRPGPRGPGPRAPPPGPAYQDGGRRRIERCLRLARDSALGLAAAIADRVMALHASLEPRDDLTIARSFRVVPLRGGLAPPELCDEPLIGVAQPGGSTEDGPSRLLGWQFLRLAWPPLREGHRAERHPPEGCHGAKKPVITPLQWILARMGGAPELAQLALVRVGDVWLAALPAEVTTLAGELMRDSIRAALPGGAAGIRHVGIVSLTNGYLSYVTTAAEYGAQHYEGASNLYGPRTAEAFARLLAEMARGAAPPVAPDPIRLWPW